MNKKNTYSHFTAKERNKLSFPMNWLKREKKLKDQILDFGCGFGTDVTFLKENNYNIHGFDPYYFSKYPETSFDTITCLYVLNVLEPIEQSKVLLNISRLLKQGGKAYFAVRRDLVYEGYRMHKIHKKHTFQTNVKLPFKSIFKNKFCEIYEYQHFNIYSKANTSCVLCSPSAEVIIESASAYSIFDKFPVSEGHALIIPKRHVSSYFELTQNEQIACQLNLAEMKKIIDEKYNPDGYNIGININEAAGQTIPHVHIHLIPRYKGDVENPVGGIRNIIPDKGDYVTNPAKWHES